MRLVDFFDRAVAMHPDAVFLQQGTVARRYCEAHDNSHRIAAALQRSAVAERSPIGFYMPNDWRGIEALYGALRSGAPLAQVNARNSVKENATFLNDAGAGALFFHSKYADEAEAVLSQCAQIELALDGTRRHQGGGSQRKTRGYVVDRCDERNHRTAQMCHPDAHDQYGSHRRHDLRA